MEAASREVADAARLSALAAADSATPLKLGPDELAAKLVRYVDEALQVGWGLLGFCREEVKWIRV